MTPGLRTAAFVAGFCVLLASGCSSTDVSSISSPQPPPSFATPAAGSFHKADPDRRIPRPARNWLQAGCRLPLDYLRRIRRGYYPGRSPEIVLVPRKPNFFGGLTSTTHSGPWPYVQRVPLVLYGPGYVKRATLRPQRETTLVDLAPTLARIVGLKWPSSRPGSALEGALQTHAKKPPRLVVTIVWDGGGWDVLDRWPHAWPALARMMRLGASIKGVTVGTSPSVTPASHATIGTGTWPRVHGIVDIPQREGDSVIASFPAHSPRLLNVPTFADLYDRSTGNKAKVGMIAYLFDHLGMMGHGAELTGGDLDTAVIADAGPGGLITNPDYYTLPPYLQSVPGYEDDLHSVDRSDGKADNRWMGHDLRQLDVQRHSPVWELYQTRLLKALVEGDDYGADGVTDLLFVNYKEIDDVGHNWNMLNPEMRSTLRYADRSLAEIERFLNDEVGRNRWVVALTADHGQAPDPRAVGAWPIRMQVLTRDLAAHFDVSEDELLDDERPVGLWLDADGTAAAGITQDDVANWLIDYRLEDNVPVTEKLSPQYAKRKREPVFSAAFPGRGLPRIWRCARKRQS